MAQRYAGNMPSTVVTLLTKPGCHLCDDARAVVNSVLADFSGVALDEQSILDDPELLERYHDEIPVVLIDGRVHNVWRVDPVRFRSALERATT
jgi:glutaredoxin